MAVQLNYSICNDPNCKIIKFRETTGVYDATTNTGGWGAPNELTTDAVTATLLFKAPSGVTYTAVDVLGSGFPKSDGSVAIEINSTDLLSTLSKFEDGFWEITYTVTTATATYSTTNTLFFPCGVKGLVCNEVAGLDINDCCCDLDKVNRILQMEAYMSVLEYAVGCGNIVGANNILTTLNRLIECSICN
jgi:hypothetical protein